MATSDPNPQREILRSSLLDRLLRQHGEILDTEALMALLKFDSNRGFRRTAAKGALPVQVFHIRGRKGWFARTQDVALWLSQAEFGDFKPDTSSDEEVPMT